MFTRKYSGLNLEEYNLAFKTLLEISLTFLTDLLGFYFILLYKVNQLKTAILLYRFQGFKHINLSKMMIDKETK